MRQGLKSVAFAGLLAVGFGSAAQAGEFSITISGGQVGSYRSVADYDDDGFSGGRTHVRRERHWDRDPDRFYGRPVPEWRERPSRWERPYGVPVAERRGWHGGHGRPSWHEPCRIVIKDRINRWGEHVQIRKQICR